MKATAICGLLLAIAPFLAAQQNPEVALRAAMHKETVEGDLKGAIDLYKKIVAGAEKNRGAAATALLRLGECYEKQGDAEARKAYERLVREFSDQKEQAQDAGARLAVMGRTTGGGEVMTAQLIAKGSGLGVYGSHVTADGRLLPSLDLNTGDIAVRDLRSGTVRRLTNEGTGIRFPAVRGFAPIPSRNGRQIAFNWRLAPDHAELRVINMDGSGMRTVPMKRNHGDTYTPVDWSPDGKSILAAVYVHAPYFWGLATVDVTTGEVRRIPKSEERGDDIAGFSPDGRYVVYARTPWRDGADWDIFALDTQTGQETAVVTGAGADRMPVWVPDGDAIVFRSDRGGKNAIWMIRVRDGQAAGAPVLLKPDAGDYSPKGISRDGALYYDVWNWSEDIYQAAVDPRTLRVHDTPARLVETFLGYNSQPLWSPSGDSFAYYSERDKTRRVVVRHRDSKETVVAGTSPWTEGLHWCGSGDRLTSWGIPASNQLQLFDARTGAGSPPQSIKGLRSPYQVEFSPDCSSVYISTYSYESRRRRIYRYEMATGKEQDLLIDGGDWATGPRVSPDGRWLALYGRLDGGKELGILLLSTDGGPLRMLDSKAQWGHVWSPDSKRLLFTRSVKRPDGQGEENELYWVGVEGGASQPLGVRMAGASAASLNADGRRILFSASEEVSNELWVLRNLPLHLGREEVRQAAPAKKVTAPESITKGRSGDFTGRVTADGRLLPFVDRNTGDICVRDLRTGEVRRLTREGKQGRPLGFGGEFPVPSRDGKQIAYGWRLNRRETELRVISIDGGAARTVPVKLHFSVIPADWAPDGKTLVAFWREGDGTWQGITSQEMATVDLTTGEQKRLVTCEASSPTAKCRGPWDLKIAGFSPDGRWIAYSRPTAPGQGSQIFALDRQTGEETVLVPRVPWNSQPMWAPGSNRIVFPSNRNGKNGIWMVGFQSGFAAGAPVLVRHDVGEADWKGISRDGALFYAERRGGSYVYQAAIDPQTMQIAGRPAKVGDARPGKAHRPSWSPRGDQWAYLAMRGGRENANNLLVIRQPDGKEVEVLHSAQPRYLPRWCEADGHMYVSLYTEIFLQRFDARTGAAAPLSPDLLRRQPHGADWGYTFSPDCQSVYITHSTLEGPRRVIVRYDIATGKETELLNDTGHFAQTPYISPDGRWLAFVGQVPGKGLCLLALPTGGGPLRVVGEVGDGEAAVAAGDIWAGAPVHKGIAWTPDSRRLLYPRRGTALGDVELYWAPIDGGPPQPLGISMLGATAPSVHPDGKRLLFSAHDDTEELRVMRSLPLN